MFAKKQLNSLSQQTQRTDKSLSLIFKYLNRYQFQYLTIDERYFDQINHLIKDHQKQFAQILSTKLFCFVVKKFIIKLSFYYLNLKDKIISFRLISLFFTLIFLHKLTYFYTGFLIIFAQLIFSSNYFAMKNVQLIFLMLLVSGLSMIVNEDRFKNASIVRILAAHKHLHITYTPALSYYEYDNAPFLQVIRDFVKNYVRQKIFIADYSFFFLEHIKTMQEFQKQLSAIQGTIKSQKEIQLASKLVQQLTKFHKRVYQYDSTDPGRFVGLLDAQFLPEGLGTDEEIQKYRKVQGFPRIASLPYSYQYFHTRVRKNSSKYGQDGVIEAIFDLIKRRNNFFVQIGDGNRTGNTYYLRTHKEWNGIVFKQGEVYKASQVDPMVKYSKITSTNVLQIFKSQQVPKQLDFLSIDMHGNDYWITKEILKQYKPAAMSIGFNSNFPYGTAATIKNCMSSFQWNSDKYYGASIRALYDLATENGYSYVYHFYFSDVFFVRTDLLTQQYRGMNIKQTFHTYPIHLMSTNFRKFSVNDLASQDSKQCYYYQEFVKNRKVEDLNLEPPPPPPPQKIEVKVTPVLRVVIYGAVILGFLYGFSMLIKNMVEKQFKTKYGSYIKQNEAENRIT